MQRADARAALTLEEHISTTLMIVRRAPAGALPFA